MGTIIDRRLNQGQKNLGNRQRFIRKAKDQIKKAITKNIKNDTDSDENIKIPIDSIDEPTFGNDWNTGINRRVLPGNKDYVPQDQIERPKGGDGSKGSKPSDDDETGNDEFSFVLTKEEFYDLFFEDLELPDLVKKQLKSTKSWEYKREGISTAGNPTNISIIRTMKQSIGRRLILRKPNEKELQELEEELKNCDPSSDRFVELQEQIKVLKNKIKSVTYVDPIDLRYNVFSKKEVPSNSAVMLAIMDVSGSMDERKKDIAKRFFMLLYLFLQKKYDNVVIEFIRHHTEAEVVDEQTFFYDTLTGGTKVSSALELAKTLIATKYSSNLYNIYICQASDGDNFNSDNDSCIKILEEDLLPTVQYMAYVEVPDQQMSEYSSYQTTHTLFDVYLPIASNNPKLQITRVSDQSDIYPVFRKLFEKK